MTREQFDRLPELLTRQQVVECGVPAASLRDLRVELKGELVVPRGKIGVVRLPGRHCKQAGKAKFKYRKGDVASLIGYDRRK